MNRVGQTLRYRVLGLMASSPDDLAQLTASDIRVLVQELDTHQVELEQQNEELRLAQLALADSRDRWSDLYEFAPVGYVTLDALGIVRASNLAAADLLGSPRQKLVGRRFSSFVAPVDVLAFAGYFADALVNENKVQGEIAVFRSGRAGDSLRLRLESIRIPDDGSGSNPGPRCQMALIDVTQAALDKANLRELNRGLEEAVAERTRDLNDSLRHLRANEERLALALDAGVMRPWTLDLDQGRSRDGDTQRSSARNAAGHATSPEAAWLGTLHPEDRPRLAAVIGRAIAAADRVLAAEFRTLRSDGTSHWFAVRGRVILDSMRRPTRIVGVTQDIDDRKRLELEVLQTADRAQRRIGQELHDDIQQRLTGLGLLAESLCDAIAQRSSPEEALCRRLSLEIQETAERVNRLAHGLVPLQLEAGGLVVALHRLACATDTPGRLHATFEHDKSLRVPDGFSATHLHRIAQEAVTNAVRHSGAANISIRLRREARGAVLSVSDDGEGISPRGSDGRGLHIMAYRASLIGATLHVARSKPHGTRVTCTFGPPGTTDGASGAQ